MAVIYWLIAAAVFVILEILTMGLMTIWFAGGSLAGAAASAAGLPLWAQIVVFVAVSIVLLIPIRPFAKKCFNSKIIKTNADSLVGCTCIVTQTINNLQAQGQVSVKGQVWTARSVSEEVILPEDTKVRITGISGVKLIVEPVSE